MTVTAKRLDRTVQQNRCAEREKITRQSFSELVHRYVYAPIIRAGGKPPRKITVREAWAVMIARRVRAHGESLETAMHVCEMLRTSTSREVEQNFAINRTCLYIVAGRVAPMLFRREAFATAELQQLRELGKAETIDPPKELIIDTRPMLLEILALAEDEFSDDIKRARRLSPGVN